MNGKNMIKAIATNYGGCFFRSRLEARWAIYFDAIGWRWNYEAEGFELPGGGRYLPDFWFPEFDLCAEIKPESAPDTAFNKTLTFAGAGKRILLLDGLPKRSAYPCASACVEQKYSTALVSLVPFKWKYGPLFLGGSFPPGDWSEYDHVTKMACDRANMAQFEFGQTPDAEMVRKTAKAQFEHLGGRRT